MPERAHGKYRCTSGRLVAATERGDAVEMAGLATESRPATDHRFDRPHRTPTPPRIALVLPELSRAAPAGILKAVAHRRSLDLQEPEWHVGS